MSTHISIKNLSVKFRLYHQKNPSLKDKFLNIFKNDNGSNYEDFFALKNLTLEIEEGTVLGIIGNNGSGKSTLLKCICGIYKSNQGVMNVNGAIAPLIELGAGFHPELTGLENFYLNGAILGLSKKDIKNKITDVFEFADLVQFIDTPVKYYSSGMYTRLAFSVATSVSSDILIFDEVFSTGDPSFVEKAHIRLTELMSKAKIILIVSHDKAILEYFCNRIIWLEKGRLIKDGKPSKILKEYFLFKH